MLFRKKKAAGSEFIKKGNKCYKIKYIYETDMDSDDSAKIDSDSCEIEEPEPVPKVKKGKWKIAQETDVKEHVWKQCKRNVDSSHKSDEKTSGEKSDDNSKSDSENITKTLKHTDSVETVKPFAQGAMPMPVQGQGQQSLLGLQSYSNVMPGVEAVQPQMMSPYGM